MLQLDDVQLYELSEAGALLFSDPARLARRARLRQIPAARVAARIGLPAPWVEAECGRSGADPASLSGYWLERLAPPAADARRPRRARERLPAEALLTADETAARVCATAPALRRLTEDGTLPALRVEGELRYDAALVDLVATEDDADAAAERRALVREWARFEYETVLAPPAPAPLPPAALPQPPTFPSPPATEPAEPATPSPGAYEIPEDLAMDDIEPLPIDAPKSDLIDVDGFETIDED